MTEEEMKKYRLSVAFGAMYKDIQEVMEEMKKVPKIDLAPFQKNQKTNSSPLFELSATKTDISQAPKKFVEKYDGMGVIPRIQKATSKVPLDSALAQYYGNSTKLADREEPSKYMKEQNSFYKIKDIKNEDTRNTLSQKAAKMYNLNPADPSTYDKVKNIKS